MHKRNSLSRREFLRSLSVGALGGTALKSAGDRAVAVLAHSPGERWSSRPADAERYWRLVKEEFLIEEGLHYMNTGTYGPSLRSVYDAACRHLRELDENFNRYFRTKLVGQALFDLIDKVAAFAGAKPDEIAFTSGTTEAMNYIANGLDLRAGDEVVTTMHEHEAGIYPWLLIAKRRGIGVRQIPLSSPPRDKGEILDRFSRAITPRTRVLSFCHVQFTDGTVLPVRELCQLARERGILSVVDGAQAVGMLNFRVSDLGCDFYATSLHKWLTTPYGTGLLYVREEVQDRLWPTVVLDYSGWRAVDRAGGTSEKTYKVLWPKAMGKYCANLQYYGPLFEPVGRAIDFQNAIGRERIEQRIRALAERLKAGLMEIPGVTLYTSRDPALSAGLTSFRLSGISTEALFRYLADQHRIIIRYVRLPGINFDVDRVSTHIFNTMDEVDALLEAVRDMAEKRSGRGR